MNIVTHRHDPEHYQEEWVDTYLSYFIHLSLNQPCLNPRIVHSALSNIIPPQDLIGYT